MTSEVETKKSTLKKRAIVYYEDSPNGIMLQAEDNKSDIEELNQWIRRFIELPRGKYYEFGSFVIPENEWKGELYARLCADFEVKPLTEAHGWVGELDKLELLSKAIDGLGFEYHMDMNRDILTVFLKG